MKPAGHPREPGLLRRWRVVAPCLLALLVTACGEDPTAADYLDNARTHLAGDDARAAYVDLKNALREDPDLPEARWLLGRLLLGRGDATAAAKELRAARELGWEANDVVPALAIALLALDQPGEVIALDTGELAAETAARVMALQAEASLSRRDVTGARELLARALERDPDSPEAKLVQAGIHSLEGDIRRAISTAGEVIRADPRNADAWRVMGLNLQREGMLNGARVAFTKAIDFAELAPAARVGRALVNLRLGDLDAVATDAEALLRIAPDSPTSRYIQGLLQFHSGRYAEALKAFEAARPAAERYPDVFFYLARVHAAEGEEDEALSVAARFHGLRPSHVPGRKLLAALELARGKVDDARRLLQPVIDYDPLDIEALRLMANIDLAQGNTAQSLSQLRQISRLGGREALVAAGDEHELAATPWLQSANSELAEIVVLLEDGKREQAVSAARNYQLQHADEAGAYHLLARTYLAVGRPDDAREVLDIILERDPHDPGAYLMRAGMALGSGHTSEGRRLLEAAIEYHADYLPAQLQLAMLDSRQGKEAALQSRLQHAARVRPDALDPRLGLAINFLRQGQPGSVAEQFEGLEELQLRSPRVRGLLSAAKLARAETGVDPARLAPLLDASPSSEFYAYLLAVAARDTPLEDEVRRDLETTLALSPHYTPTLLGLVVLAQAAEDEAAFDRYLSALLERTADTELPLILRLRAIAASRQGNLAEAAELTRAAFDQAPETRTLLELVSYLRGSGQVAAARAVLEDWVGEHPGDVQVRLQLAQVCEVAGDTNCARTHYAAILEQRPKHLAALNNLAWLLREEDAAQSLDYIRRAREFHPGQPDVLDSLAVIEYLNGNHARALVSIEHALSLQPQNPSMQYHRAMILAGAGRTAEAVEALESIATADFPERQSSRALLEELRASPEGGAGRGSPDGL